EDVHPARLKDVPGEVVDMDDVGLAAERAPVVAEIGEGDAGRGEDPAAIVDQLRRRGGGARGRVDAGDEEESRRAVAGPLRPRAAPMPAGTSRTPRHGALLERKCSIRAGVRTRARQSWRDSPRLGNPLPRKRSCQSATNGHSSSQAKLPMGW